MLCYFNTCCKVKSLIWHVSGMKINVLKGDQFEVNPEDTNVTFNDVLGVGSLVVCVGLFFT